MANIYYATFSDSDNAERAIGALLDHGVRSEDLSVIRSNAENTAVISRPGTGENDLKNAGDAGVGYAKEAGNRVAEYGDEAAGAIAGTFGEDNAAANYDASAERRAAIADSHHGAANSQYAKAVDATSPTDYRNETVAANPLDDVEDSAKHGISTTTGADAGAGAIKGTAWGVGLGAVAALAALAIPGFGLVLGGGALAAALGATAAAAGAGAAAGAVVGYLKDQGLEEHVANEYGNAIGAGGTLIAVTLPSGSCSEAEGTEVLNKYGASNVRNQASHGYVA